MRKKKWLALTVGALLLKIIIGAGTGWWWIAKRPVPMQSERIDYIVESGSGPYKIGQIMQRAGSELNPRYFSWLARATEQDKRLQAGAYEAVHGDSLWQLLQRMVQGDMQQTRLQFIEGWDYKRIRATLAASPYVQHSTDLDDAQLLAQLGSEYSHPEGLFYPDTYVFAPGTRDFDILRRAYQAQMETVEQLWAERDADLPLKTPYEALILASIIEKETGHGADRYRVAGVFVNRLRKGMLLQTDPTVIYGMGEAYTGRIRKVDLQTDTPWNTYTRAGLPPTPIATPSKAALEAALHPEKHNYYYFVSKGDGTSEFSRNLNEHNRAVRKYILNKK